MLQGLTILNINSFFDNGDQDDIDKYGPQKPTFKEGTPQWQKDFENWNYEVELKNWNKKTYNEKLVIVRQKIAIAQLNNAFREPVEQIAELYTALAYMGGSGMSSGLSVTGSLTKGGQFSKGTIDQAVNIIMNNNNNVRHIFAPKHNLGTVVNKLGGQENTIRSVLNAANGKLPANGIFYNVPVNVGGQTILIRGSVVNGVPRIGTMFIP